MSTANSESIEFIKLGVLERIELIEAKLLEQDPMLPNHLAAIHSALLQYEELVHLLPDEKIRAFVRGQTKHVGMELVKESISAKKPKVAKNTADDF